MTLKFNTVTIMPKKKLAEEERFDMIATLALEKDQVLVKEPLVREDVIDLANKYTKYGLKANAAHLLSLVGIFPEPVIKRKPLEDY